MKTRQIKIPVWVEGDLAAADVSARLEGSASRVLGVQGPRDDLMVLLVLDLSDDLALAETARAALIAEIEKLPERAYIGVLRAQNGLSVLLDPSAEHAAIRKTIEEIAVSGKAGLLETVETVQRIADSVLAKTDVRVAILYITDSEVRNYREDFTNPVINYSDRGDLSRRFPEALIQERITKLRATLSGGQAPLFIVHVRYRSERMEEAYQNGLKQLAEVTGGQSWFCRSSVEIPDAVARSLGLIASHYTVTLALPERPGRNVAVELQAGDGRSLSYRPRFVVKEK